MAQPVFDFVRNFRDCGGYATRDGGSLRSGRLYRSAQMSEATDADLARLRALGIATIVDLRRPNERLKYPCRRWPDFAAHVIEHDGYEDGVLPPHLAAFADAGESAATARRTMLEIYRGFPFDPMLVDLYRDLFTVLAEGEGAVLVHCAAGKDRTGFGVALVQHLAGLNRDTIVTEFLKTNQSDLVSDTAITAMRENAGRENVTFSNDAILTVLTVEPDYLDASFATIEARSGSLDGYLRDVLGVTAERAKKIHERFVG